MKKKALLAKAENEALVSGQNSRVRMLRDETNILLDKEAHLWRQRSHVPWLKMVITTQSSFTPEPLKDIEKI